jgi:hypothetical protein
MKKSKNYEEELHESVGISNLASFIGRKMIGRCMRCTIDINMRVTNIVLKGMVNGGGGVGGRLYLQGDK